MDYHFRSNLLVTYFELKYGVSVHALRDNVSNRSVFVTSYV